MDNNLSVYYPWYVGAEVKSSHFKGGSDFDWVATLHVHMHTHILKHYIWALSKQQTYFLKMEMLKKH